MPKHLSKYQTARISFSRFIRGMFSIFLAFGFFLSTLLFTGNVSEGTTQELSENRSGLILDETDRVCDEFFSPYSETDRKSVSLLKDRITGIYGEYRRSYKPGHFHVGQHEHGRAQHGLYRSAQIFQRTSEITMRLERGDIRE